MPRLLFSAPIFSIAPIRPVVHRTDTAVAIRRHRRDSFAPRLIGMKAMESTLSREGIIVNFDPNVYCSRVHYSSLFLVRSAHEINVGIDTSRLGSRLASSPPQCVPRQMSLSIRRCIVSRRAVRLFSSPSIRFQRGFFCRYLDL